MSNSQLGLEQTPWTQESLCSYLESLGYRRVRLLRQVDLSRTGEQGVKGFGYGRPFLVEFETEDGIERLVVHTLSPDSFGHDRLSDRAESLILAHQTFNRLPRHVGSIDVGGFTEDGDLVSLGKSREFFLLTEYAPGVLYASDLERIRDSHDCTESDRKRTQSLARYLAGVHGTKHEDARAYERRIRDLVGHGEGIMGLLDSYPADFSVAGPPVLKRIEHATVDWRWRLRSRSHRLSQVHGDFHPFNILMGEDDEFWLLDRSRGEWGEPADDVTALSINYIFFALQSEGCFRGPLRRLFELFWNTYLTETGDREVLETAPPFFAWRGLVVASPVWYPSISKLTRAKLFRFVENVLSHNRFDPAAVYDYLERT